MTTTRTPGPGLREPQSGIKFLRWLRCSTGRHAWRSHLLQHIDGAVWCRHCARCGYGDNWTHVFPEAA